MIGTDEARSIAKDWSTRTPAERTKVAAWVRDRLRMLTREGSTLDREERAAWIGQCLGWGLEEAADTWDVCVAAGWGEGDGETMIPVVTEPDHSTFPHEITRGGITWGVERPISDDEVVAAFIFEGKIAPTIWVDQAFPVRHDLIPASAIGIDGGPVKVGARYWKTPMLLLIGVARFEGEVPEVAEEDEP